LLKLVRKHDLMAWNDLPVVLCLTPVATLFYFSLALTSDHIA